MYNHTQVKSTESAQHKYKTEQYTQTLLIFKEIYISFSTALSVCLSVCVCVCVNIQFKGINCSYGGLDLAYPVGPTQLMMLIFVKHCYQTFFQCATGES